MHRAQQEVELAAAAASAALTHCRRWCTWHALLFVYIHRFCSRVQAPRKDFFHVRTDIFLKPWSQVHTGMILLIFCIARTSCSSFPPRDGSPCINTVHFLGFSVPKYIFQGLPGIRYNISTSTLGVARRCAINRKGTIIILSIMLIMYFGVPG